METRSVLRKASELRGSSLLATDGEIGKTEDFYFNDESWTIRYLVVQTGSWLLDRRVLISPIALGRPIDQEQTIPVKLSREQVEKSPGIDSEKPVSRQYEMSYYTHYGWPYYWHGPGPWGFWPYPTDLLDQPTPQEPPTRDPGDPRLRSVREVEGYRLEARDGQIGHVEDFLIDDPSWSIVYLAVDTRNWWPGGKRVLLARQWIEEVMWDERKVKVDLDRETLRKAPEYDPRSVVSREYEVALFEHYGKKLEER